MERLKRITYLLCLLTLFGLAGADNVRAQNSQLTKQLNTINQQEDHAQSLIDLSQLINDNKYQAAEKAEILLQKGKTFLNLHRYDAGIDVTLQARRLAEESKKYHFIAQTNKFLGVLYYYQGELKKSLAAYQASLAYFERNQSTPIEDFTIERANLFNNIALVYTSLGQVSLALKNYQLAEQIYANYGDEVDKIDVRYNIALLHITLQRYDTAIDILKVVILRRQELNDSYGVATAKAYLGLAFKYSGQLELAKENIYSALLYFEEHNYKHDVASQLHNMAEIHNDMFEPEQATFYAKKAMLASEAVGHQKALAGSLHSLAKAAFLSGELAKAEHYLQRSNQLARKINYERLITENIALYALVNAGKNQFKKAAEQQRKFVRVYQRNANNTLNDKLAEFESAQLNQQILDLENRRKLQKLESAKKDQQRTVIFLVIMVVFMVAFYIYRRYLEKRLTTELELRVKQRTSELEKLTQELEKADQVKNQFLANMSHEIRTPLTAILGHSEAIIHDNSGKEIKTDIEVIHGNSLHLLELINDILDLSRIEADKLELEIQPLELGELIQDLSHTFTPQAEKKYLRFTIDNQLALPFIIHVDSLRLKQILFNLCSNAIKFTEKGDVSLTISGEDEKLFFTVLDTGIGLSDDHISQVFNSFTQADNSISRRFGGSGLGLTLSKQLAKLMSGNISVSSELGKGSRFCLSMPYKRHYGGCELDQPVSDLTPNENIEQLLKGKILLAEDHNDNRRLIARLLSSLGLDVIVAKNGLEAVQLCLEHQPQLVLLDIQMPEMDGVEAFKVLRSLDCNQPIYALTANAMSHEVSKYLGLGFTGHLKKPIERKKFIAIIAKYFNTHAEIPETDKNQLPEEYEDTLSKVDLSDLVGEFKASLLTDKQNIIDYNKSQNLSALSGVAHQLAGAAQMFGFVEINQAALELEQAIKSEVLTKQPNYSFIDDLTHCLIDEISLVEPKQ